MKIVKKGHSKVFVRPPLQASSLYLSAHLQTRKHCGKLKVSLKGAQQTRRVREQGNITLMCHGETTFIVTASIYI